MPFSLPNPTSPTNGQSLDATPILANEVAIANAIASFDGSQIQAGTVPSSAFATTANPNTLIAAITQPFVQSGVVWTTVSGLAGTMSGGTIYYNGTPVTVNSVASHTFTASKDTYVDVDKNGNVTYQAVTNGAASPSLTANSVRVAVVITGASAITSITLNGIDTLGDYIYPISPVPISTNIFGNSVQSYTNAGSAGGTGYYINLGGIKFCWGTTAQVSNSGTGFQQAVYVINLPTSFFSTIQSINVTTTGGAVGATQYQGVSGASVAASAVNFFLCQNNGSNGTAICSWFVVGT